MPQVEAQLLKRSFTAIEEKKSKQAEMCGM
jgi:hypothetical protein